MSEYLRSFALILMVAVAIPIGDCCTQGFTDFDTVCSSCAVSTNVGNSGATYIIPDMTFTCNGSLVRWRAAGMVRSIENTRAHPTLQIWRPVSSSSTTYTRIIEIPLLTCNGESTVTVNTDVHECRLTTSVTVQAGDILGIYLTRRTGNRGQFQVFFNNVTSQRLRYDGTKIQISLHSPSATEQGLPLIVLEVIANDIATEPTQGVTESGTSVERTTEVETELDTTIETTQEMIATVKTTQEMIATVETTQEMIATVETTQEMIATVETTQEMIATVETTQEMTELDTTTQRIIESSAATVETPQGKSGPNGSNNRAVMIVGVVIALLLAILIAILIFFFVVRSLNKHKREKNNSRSQSLSQRNSNFIEEATTEDRIYEEIPMETTNNNDSSPFIGHYSLLRATISPQKTVSTNYCSQMNNSIAECNSSANNPVYIFGVYVPSEDQRKELSLKSQDSTTLHETLGRKQFGGNPDKAPEFFTESEYYWKPASNSRKLYTQLSAKKYREISRHQIKVVQQIGSGQFGTVNKGVWQINGNLVLDCAIKTLHVGSSEDDRVQFLQEAAINGQFHHPNIVLLLGVVTLGEPAMIVLELLSNGDLFKYLHKIRPSPGELISSETPYQLLKFCQHISSGMEYLSRKAFVHRDLAARNILVTDDKICKISDFGMSRNTTDDYYMSHGGKVPVKWTSPEAIHYKKYSSASDVWSFGAVMYEIWSLGHKPFEENNNLEVIKLVDKGYRLPPPPGCSKRIYQLMIQCWNPDSKSRPTFSHLVESLNVPEFEVLSFTEEEETDRNCGPDARRIGAPLKAGNNLYLRLQHSFQ